MFASHNTARRCYWTTYVHSTPRSIKHWRLLQQPANVCPQEPQSTPVQYLTAPPWDSQHLPTSWAQGNKGSWSWQDNEWRENTCWHAKMLAIDMQPYTTVDWLRFQQLIMDSSPSSSCHPADASAIQLSPNSTRPRKQLHGTRWMLH